MLLNSLVCSLDLEEVAGVSVAVACDRQVGRVVKRREACVVVMWSAVCASATIAPRPAAPAPRSKLHAARPPTPTH